MSIQFSHNDKPMLRTKICRIGQHLPHVEPSPIHGYNWQRSAAMCLGRLLCQQYAVYVLSPWKLFYSDRTTPPSVTLEGQLYK